MISSLKFDMLTGTHDGFRLALNLSVVRVVALGVLALGLSTMGSAVAKSKNYRTVGYRMPLAAAAFLVGLLSIAGIPLTAGFPGRWSLLTTVLQGDIFAASTLLFSMIGVGVLGIRWAVILFDKGDADDHVTMANAARGFLIGGILLLLLLGIFPQLVFPWIEDVAAGLANLFS